MGRRIGPVRYGVYASRALVERIGEGSPLSAYPWIGWDGGKHHRWFERWLAEHAPDARIVLRLPNRAPIMAHAIRSSIGVQLLPRFVGDRDPEMCRIAPLDPIFKLDLWALTLPDLRTNSRVRAFMDHMVEALGPHREELDGGGGARD